MRDARLQSERLVERPHRIGQSGGVETARVDDDLDAALLAGGRHLLQLAEEGPRVAEPRILHTVLQQDHEGQLGEIVAGEDVDRAALDHLARGAEAISVETAAIGDAQNVGHRRVPRGWIGAAVHV